ncbi:hypothetical protein [Flavobacterium lacus]|uniref:Uncharacterized protein n=1 Tax=Flavobacterium lacus TaxID=1353778 RepID=A0A328WWL8_9FLAO|nr:hypothetical protein [Flavobacterium lacus]RAR47239.1 hypothetical protein B0I10_11032 [Flavobacterium lacus]
MLLLFLFSPFLGALNLFKLKDEKTLTFFGTLFFGLLGSIFIYVEGTDGHTHLKNAENYYLDMTFIDFFQKSYEILTFNSTEIVSDIYLHIISFISASLFQTPELIHFFTGLVLGYFFSKSILLVLKNNIITKKSLPLIGLIILFLLIKSIGALNSIRMWTAMWVFFYGTFSYATTKEKKYLFVILLSVFVHFSYSIILLPVICAYLLQKRKNILVGLYVLSFFTTTSFSVFQSYIPKSELLEQKQKFTVIDSADKAKLFKQVSSEKNKAKADMNFYKASGETSYLNYSIVGLSFLLIFIFLKKNTDSSLTFLVAVGLGLYSFSNFVAFSPALQGRTKMIAATFLLAAAIHLQFVLKNYRIGTKTLCFINIGFIAFLISSIPMVLFQLSDILQNFSFFVFLLPQFSWLLGDGDYSIRGVIGLLID